MIRSTIVTYENPTESCLTENGLLFATTPVEIKGDGVHIKNLTWEMGESDTSFADRVTSVLKQKGHSMKHFQTCFIYIYGRPYLLGAITFVDV